MSYTFPLAPAAFLSLLPIQSVRFHCTAQWAATGLAGGDVLRSEVAPAMWQGSYALGPLRPRAAAVFEAMIEALQDPGASFYAYKANQIGPAEDRSGAALAGRVVKIAALDFTQSKMSLNGLPPGYQLRAGDFLAFDYGSGPAARALHRMQADKVANAQGVTDQFPVGPHLELGAVAGAVVTLIRPACKAVILPGSVDLGSTEGNFTTGISFGFRQTFR